MLLSHFFDANKIYRAIKAKCYLPIPNFSNFLQPQLAGIGPEHYLENDGIDSFQHDFKLPFFDGIWLMGVPKSKVGFVF
jgi:hypothetical protein